MEREHGSKYTETDEDEGEEHLLNLHRDIVHGGNLVDIHGRGTTKVVDAQDTNNEQSRASHQHQRQLHGRILLGTTTPHTNQQVHRDERHLIEHEHGEKVGADKEAEHTCGKQGEPEEILFSERFQLPRGKGSGEHDDTR